MSFFRFLPTLAILHTLFSLSHCAEPFFFEDVTKASGIDERRPSLKFGGPLVADFDGDGHYDLLLSYHNGDRSQLYFNNGDDTFELTKFRTRWVDVHGFACAQRSARSNERILTVSPGGGGGNNLKLPEVYIIYPNRTIEDVSESIGFGSTPGRGRNAIFMDLSRKSRTERKNSGGGPDVVFVSLLSVKTPELRQYGFRNENGEFVIRGLGDYALEKKGHVEVTDIDNDGMMEIISMQTLSMYSVVEEPGKQSVWTDMSSVYLPRVLPFSLKDRTINGVAEFDYDNDGYFDLYIARGDRSTLSRLSSTGIDTSDVLLRNVGGRYVDVTKSAGIPIGTNSLGVTAGDFNNDGYVDLLVMLYEQPDMFLINQGNGKFVRVDNLIPKAEGTVGNHGVAVDYNLDGRVDALIGHGGYRPPIRGHYFILKNIMPLNANNQYLLVNVRNDKSLTATSLHAVVTVFIGDQKLTRRVGSRGAQAGGGSYIDTVHFGLGSVTKVSKVSVKWTSGRVLEKTNVRSNRKIIMGRA